MRIRTVMYDQTYDSTYGAAVRTGKERFESDYDRSLVDKRYASNQVYGRSSNAHSYPGTTDTYHPSAGQTVYSNTCRQPSDSKMLVNVGGVRHEIL